MSRDRWEGSGISPGEVEYAVSEALSGHARALVAIARAQIAGCVVATLMQQKTGEGFDALLGRALAMADEVMKQAGVE